MKDCNAQGCLSKNCLKQAVSVLASGGVVAFPTETYYGLAVDPFNEEALEKLFSIKRRSKNKPILVLIHKLEQLFKLTDTIPDPYQPLIEKHWPGPLTLIFKAGSQVEELLTGNTGTIGVRISPHPVAYNLCRAWRNAITATSANLSGMLPARNASEVKRYFGSDIDFVIDGGVTSAESCSTIVNYIGRRLILVRKGVIDFQDLLEL